MYRARQRLLTGRLVALAAALLAAAVLLVAAPAAAFHAGSLFDKPPGAGGGGGIFYTGAPLERGWTCALCHTEAPGKVRLRVFVEPAELFETFAYVPGQTYTFTAKLEGETLGKSSPLSNYNTIAVNITDTNGYSVGSIGGFAAEDFYSGGPTTIASAGQKTGETSWKFSYTAPVSPAVGLVIHLAAVDGNGADSPPTQTLTDPFGDDVFVAAITLERGEVAALPPDRRHPWETPTFALAAALVGAFGRRRRPVSRGLRESAARPAPRS